MGTTLASYHAFGQSPETVLPLLDEGYTAAALSQDWTSILCRSPECELSDKPVKKLSRALDASVLSFLYFDDDLMSLALFKGGRLCAQYRMNDGAEPYIAHITAFPEGLGWEKGLSPRLKRIFGCSDMEEKVALLEEFFGVALLVDAEFLKDGTGAFTRVRGDTLYLEYEAKQKKLNKIKNRTRVVLTQEMDAKLAWRQPCIAVRRAEGEETYGHDIGEALELVGDVLQPMLGSFRLSGFSTKIYIGREWYTVTNEFRLAGRKGHTAARVSREGEVLAVIPIAESMRVGDVLEDGELVCVTGYDPKKEEPVYVLRLNEHGKVLWRVPFKDGDIWIKPVLHKEYLYFGGRSISREADGMLFKLDRDGNIIATLSTPYTHKHSELLFDGGFVYYLGATFDAGWNGVLLKLDETLRIVETVAVPKGVSIYSDAYFDRRHGRIYYNALDKRLVRFDLADMRCTVARTDEQIYLSFADEGGYIYGFSGFSTLCVLDADMKLISRHRLKGSIFDVRRSETGVHALTATGDMAAWNFPEPPCYIRVYRIDPA